MNYCSKLNRLIFELASASIIVIDKTWEKPNSLAQNENLNGYNSKAKVEVLVCIRIGSNLIFFMNPQLSVMNEKIFESLLVTVSFKNKSIIISGIIYRLPHRDNSSFESFNNNLYNILQKLAKHKQNTKTKYKCFILGDFNFNLLGSSDQLTKSFTDTMFSFNYYPLTNKPTRIQL